MSFAWHEIHDHLLRSSSTLRFQRGFEAIRRTGHELARFRDPAAVLDALHRGSGSPDQKNLILLELVAAAQSGGLASDCAVTLMLLALWPGLDAIRRRSFWRERGTREEIGSDILARTTEAIRSLDLHRVTWVAATVLRNVERDMIRIRRRETDRQSGIVEIAPDTLASHHDRCGPALSYDLLHRDVRRLIGADARLVIRVAVAGFSQAEAGIQLGLSEASARKRYQRAMGRLRDGLQQYV